MNDDDQTRRILKRRSIAYYSALTADIIGTFSVSIYLYMDQRGFSSKSALLAKEIFLYSALVAFWLMSIYTLGSNYFCMAFPFKTSFVEYKKSTLIAYLLLGILCCSGLLLFELMLASVLMDWKFLYGLYPTFIGLIICCVVLGLINLISGCSIYSTFIHLSKGAQTINTNFALSSPRSGSVSNTHTSSTTIPERDPKFVYNRPRSNRRNNKLPISRLAGLTSDRGLAYFCFATGFGISLALKSNAINGSITRTISVIGIVALFVIGLYWMRLSAAGEFPAGVWAKAHRIGRYLSPSYQLFSSPCLKELYKRMNMPSISRTEVALGSVSTRSHRTTSKLKPGSPNLNVQGVA